MYERLMNDDAGNLLCLIGFCTQGPAPVDDLPRKETENIHAVALKFFTVKFFYVICKMLLGKLSWGRLFKASLA